MAEPILKSNPPVRRFSEDEISALTLEDLQDPEILEEIHYLVLVLADARDAGGANKLERKLRELIGESEKTTKLDLLLYNKYQDEITLLKFIDLVSLRDQEIENLFSTKLLFALRLAIKVKELLEFYILTFGSAEIGVKFANTVIRTMAYSEEKIGKEPINIEGEARPVAPYLRNWLRSYNQSLKAEKVRGVLEQSEYLSSNKNVAKLSGEEKKLLEEIIKIYDFLRFPSEMVETIVPRHTLPLKPIKLFKSRDERIMTKTLITPSAVPPTSQPARPVTPSWREKQEEGSLGQLPQTTLTTGSPSPLTRASGEVRGPRPTRIEKPKIPREKIIRAYLGDENEENLIALEEETIKRSVKAEAKRVSDILWNALEAKDKNRTLACLKILAKAQLLDNLLKDEQRFSNLLAENLKDKPFLFEGFKIHPKAPQYLRILLSLIFQDRLGLGENEAARLGLRLGNMLGEKYKKIAYWDMRDERFHWKL